MLSSDLSVCLPSLDVLDSRTNEIVCDSLMNEIVAAFYAHYFLYRLRAIICDRLLVPFIVKVGSIENN